MSNGFDGFCGAATQGMYLGNVTLPDMGKYGP